MLCVIFNKTIADLKEDNIKRQTTHFQNYARYTYKKYADRKFEVLKLELKLQQTLFIKISTEQEAATRASFHVALEITTGKPIANGKDKFKTISLSANTEDRLVKDNTENISY